MKKIVLVLLCLLLLTACDPHHGKRPSDYPNTVWTCEDPAITFYVAADGKLLLEVAQPHADVPGGLVLAFNYGSGMHLRENGRTEPWFSGSCKFHPSRLELRVTHDELFEGRYLGSELVFTRADWDGQLPEGVTEALVPQSASPLCGVWINAGQSSEGRDFVETLTLRGDGSVTVHLDYRGADYATLEGSWTAENGVLNVDFTDPDTRDRSYLYTLKGTSLTLTGEEKTVEYVRK